MSTGTQFQGTAFAKDLPSGQAPVSVNIDGRGIVGIMADGSELVVPFSDCKVLMGGMSGKMFFCNTSDSRLSIGCDQPGFREALTLAGGGMLGAQIDGLRKAKSGENFRWKLLGLSVLALVFLMLVGGYYGLMAGARATVKTLPLSVDKEIGDAMIGGAIAGKESDDEVVVAAIETIVKRLEPHAKLKGFEFNVHVVDDEVMNAFALPGGQIVVYTELIRKASRPEEVAGVIAHEMAHVTMRHGLEGVAKSIGISAAFGLMFGDASGFGGVGARVLEEAALNSYSRMQESDADAEGVRMLHAAKIDPHGLADFFDLLKKEAGGMPGAMQWISTHPAHNDRIHSIEDQLKGLDAHVYEPLDIDWDDIHERLK